MHRRVRLYNVAMLLLAAVVITTCAVTMYDNPQDSIAYLIGNYLGGLLIGWLIAWAVTRKPAWRRIRTPIALSIAVVAMIATNGKELLTAYEARQVRNILKDVAGPAEMERTIGENKNNRILAMINFAIKSAKKSQQELLTLVASMQPAALDVPIEFDKASKPELEQYRQGLVIAEGNALAAESQLDFIFSQEKTRFKDFLRTKQFDSNFRSGALKGIEQRHKDYLHFYRRLFNLKAEEFAITRSLIAVLIKEHGKYKKNTSGAFLFQDSSAASGFNDVLSQLTANEQKQNALVTEGEAIDRRYQQRLQKFLSE